MKSPLHPSLGLALVTCASLGLGLGALRAEDTKKDPTAKPAAAPAKPAAAPAKPAAAPKAAAAPVKPLAQRPAQPQAARQLKSLNADTKSRGASAAGGTAFDGRKAAAPAVKANPSTNQKTAAQIAKEESAKQRSFDLAQAKKLKKSPEPPSPVTH